MDDNEPPALTGWSELTETQWHVDVEEQLLELDQPSRRDRESMPPPASTSRISSQADADEQASLAMIAAMTRRKVPAAKTSQPEWDLDLDDASFLLPATSGRRKQPTAKAAAAASASRAKAASKPRAKASKSHAKKRTARPKETYTSIPRASKTRAVSAFGASRSRSHSIMPEEYEAEAEYDEEEQDTKLYCVCKTHYNEEKVMIACDRCDEWYHTPCVGLPDFQLELVDQFICPVCIQKSPELGLKTTHKQRCARGLKDRYPASAASCHKPGRGAMSKYCSDECGVLYMQSRIDEWSRGGGSKDVLWHGVKAAEKREGVIISEPDGPKKEGNQGRDPKMELDDAGEQLTDEANLKRHKIDRQVARLQIQLDTIVGERDGMMNEMDVISSRERLTQLAIQRSETISTCGWDQRLLFGNHEWQESGAGVIESYEEGAGARANGFVNGDDNNHGEWWCRGPRKCDRHLGWQKLRLAEVELERELIDGALTKLTLRERHVRNRIEDVLASRMGKNEAQSVGSSRRAASGSAQKRKNMY